MSYSDSADTTLQASIPSSSTFEQSFFPRVGNVVRRSSSLLKLPISRPSAVDTPNTNSPTPEQSSSPPKTSRLSRVRNIIRKPSSSSLATPGSDTNSLASAQSSPASLSKKIPILSRVRNVIRRSSSSSLATDDSDANSVASAQSSLSLTKKTPFLYRLVNVIRRSPSAAGVPPSSMQAPSNSDMRFPASTEQVDAASLLESKMLSPIQEAPSEPISPSTGTDRMLTDSHRDIPQNPLACDLRETIETAHSPTTPLTLGGACSNELELPQDKENQPPLGNSSQKDITVPESQSVPLAEPYTFAPACDSLPSSDVPALLTLSPTALQIAIEVERRSVWNTPAASSRLTLSQNPDRSRCPTPNISSESNLSAAGNHEELLVPMFPQASELRKNKDSRPPKHSRKDDPELRGSAPSVPLAKPYSPGEEQRESSPGRIMMLVLVGIAVAVQLVILKRRLM